MIFVGEKDIRFVGFIDHKGKFQEKIIPFENDEEQKKIFRELAIRVATRKKFDYSMGRVKYSASRRENLVMMSFPLKRYTLMITAEPNINIDRLTYKIIQTLGKSGVNFLVNK